MSGTLKTPEQMEKMPPFVLLDYVNLLEEKYQEALKILTRRLEEWQDR